MNLRNTALLLACAMLLTSFAACGKEETAKDSSTSSEPVTSHSDAGTASQAETQPQEMGKIHITVESVEISLSDLKAQDYTVPVYVSLDQNAGINYSEWGIRMDSRCTFTADNYDEQLTFSVYHSINDEEHFMWTAWAASNGNDPRTGKLILLEVALPRDAGAGDTYTIEYADWSLADKGHVWSNDTEDFSENGDVTWTHGGITVTE